MTDLPGRRFSKWPGAAIGLSSLRHAYAIPTCWTNWHCADDLRDVMGWGLRDYWFPEVRSVGAP